MATEVRVNAKEWADNLEKGVRGATEKMKKGIARVKVSPGKQAAQAKRKWIDKLADPEIQDLWERRVSSMTLEEWQRLMTEKGVSRAASGVTAAKAKIEAVAEELIAHQNSGLRKLADMPKVTLADSKARMDAWFDHMTEFRRK